MTSLFMIFCFRTGRYKTVQGWSASPAYACLFTREEADQFIGEQSELALVPILYDSRSAFQNIHVLGQKTKDTAVDHVESLHIVAKAQIHQLQSVTPPQIELTKYDRALRNFDAALAAFGERVQSYERHQKAILK